MLLMSFLVIFCMDFEHQEMFMKVFLVRAGNCYHCVSFIELLGLESILLHVFSSLADMVCDTSL
jgi:hypothetical protein